MKICVLIPVHNESKAIGHLIDDLKSKGLDILVIDDGSTDGSFDIATERGAQVFRNAEKTGKGASLRRGFEYIIKNQYDGVITMDGDGQHAVEDIDKFIVAAQKDKDTIVNGNRMANAKDMPFVRFLTNKVMSSMISMVCRQHIADTQCGYRYVSVDILKKIDFSCNDFEIETELLMKSCKLKYKVVSVPIQTIYSDEKSKINPFIDTIRFIKFFIRESISSFRK